MMLILRQSQKIFYILGCILLAGSSLLTKIMKGSFDDHYDAALTNSNAPDAQLRISDIPQSSLSRAFFVCHG
jgi:hypothetical protein